MTRRVYIDWLRGIAVLCMIEWHVLDAWSVPDGRDTVAWAVIRTFGGVAAPLFLFLAGIAVPLAGDARLRRGDSAAAAARALQKRGWQIVALAHLFRLQSFLLNTGASWHAILKPDILNVLGLGLVATAVVWGRARQRDPAHRWLWWMAPVAVVLALTPWAPHWWWPTLLHPRLEAYVRPVDGWGVFTLFPAVAFVVAGAWVGEAMISNRTADREPALHRRLGLAGLGLVGAGMAVGVAPLLMPSLRAWTPDLAQFAWRTGTLLLMIWGAYAWTRRVPRDPSDAIVTFGRTSLVVYWVHVELAYGLVSYPLHRALPLEVSLAGLLIVTVLMLVLARWWDGRRPGPVVPAHMSATDG